MSISSWLFALGCVVFVIGIVLNTFHYLQLEPEFRKSLREDGGLLKWAGLLHMGLAFTIVQVESWKLAALFLVVLILEGAYFTRVHYIRLEARTLPDLWLRRQKCVDTIFLASLVFIFGSVFYSKIIPT